MPTETMRRRCKQCGYQWVPRGPKPVRCPACFTRRHKVVRRVWECGRCGETWPARKAGRPKRCHLCGSGRRGGPKPTSLVLPPDPKLRYNLGGGA